MRACFAALVFGASAIAAGAQAPGPAAEAGLRGQILTHEEAPVSSGAVVLQGPERSAVVNATIDRDGRFHAGVRTRGLYQLSINVPGLAPHRVNVDVPALRTITLPPIKLIAPTYIRARFVSAAGDAILSPRLRRRFQNGDRMSMFATEDEGPARLDDDGIVTLGPLGRGLHTLIADIPGMALTALPPVTVTGEEGVIDMGAIAIQPGTAVHVDLVDPGGAPLANHSVSIEDVASDSPLSPHGVATDQQGRAIFTRLAAGRYRVIARAVERCNGIYLLASRLVTVNGTGEAKLSMTLGGTVRLRFVTPFGALPGAPVSIVSDAGQPDGVRIPVPGRPPIAYMSSGCPGSTDDEGRVTFRNVPPGPVRIDVRANGSTHQLRANVSDDGPEMTYAIPDGFLQFQVTNESNGRPVGNATVTWNGAGRRVRSLTNGNGAALVEGLGDGTGSVSVTANGFVPAELKIIAGVASTYEVALKPEPPTERRIRIVAPDGKPIPRALVELLPPTVLDILTILVADADGSIRYFNAPPGVLSAIASAEGFTALPFSLPAANDAPVVVTLTAAR